MSDEFELIYRLLNRKPAAKMEITDPNLLDAIANLPKELPGPQKKQDPREVVIDVQAINPQEEK